MKPCYVFGPWTDRAPEDPIRAVREAPNPSERAEVWLYVREDDGTPVSSDVAGWYGCFGAMTDSIRLAGPDAGLNVAKAFLDGKITQAGHLFAENVKIEETWTHPHASVSSPLSTRVDVAERLVCVLASAADLVHEKLDLIQPYFAIWKKEGDAIEEIRRRLDEAGVYKRTTGQEFWGVARRATDADTPVGDDRAPDRYMASGRETIDEVRDICAALTGSSERAARALFAAHCLLTAWVYESRAGRKGPAEQDHAKAHWYLRMAGSVMNVRAADGGPYTDPRVQRATYTPYRRQQHPLAQAALFNGFPVRDLLGAIAIGLAD